MNPWLKEAGIQTAKGIIAGYAASQIMPLVTTELYKREDQQAKEKEESVRGGKMSFEVAAEKISRAAGLSLSDDQLNQLSSALHIGLSYGASVLYSLLRSRYPVSKSGYGLLYGFAFFLIIDEGLNAAAGFTPGPLAFPWQAHMRGLLGHIALGVTAETTLRVLDAAEEQVTRVGSDVDQGDLIAA